MKQLTPERQVNIRCVGGEENLPSESRTARNRPRMVSGAALGADEAWRAAAGGDIRESHVRTALEAAEHSMYRQIHEPMIESVTDREREYLQTQMSHSLARNIDKRSESTRGPRH